MHTKWSSLAEVCALRVPLANRYALHASTFSRAITKQISSARIGQRRDLLHSGAYHAALGRKLLTKPSNFSRYFRPEGNMKAKGVIFDRRGQYMERIACNKSRHYPIRADDICFVI